MFDVINCTFIIVITLLLLLSFFDCEEFAYMFKYFFIIVALDA